ncbi:MAG TPA: DUF2798 domain-containing protein [Cellvibrio sp.]|nr:DUF2798 domain-containing protein [Cellvibrio sp.]
MSEQTISKPGGRKLHPRYTPLAFAIFMSTIMAFLMSLVITATNQGVDSHLLGNSLHAYMLAMPVAFVCVLVVRPLVLRLVSLTVRT